MCVFHSQRVLALLDGKLFAPTPFPLPLLGFCFNLDSSPSPGWHFHRQNLSPSHPERKELGDILLLYDKDGNEMV